MLNYHTEMSAQTFYKNTVLLGQILTTLDKNGPIAGIESLRR